MAASWNRAPPKLIDIGVNLTHASFRNDCEEVIARAHRAGVHTLIVTGTSVPASRRALEFVCGRPNLYATAGVHPHDARHADAAQLEELRRPHRAPRVRRRR